MKGLRLYKKEKLCSAVAIDSLFSRGSGAFSNLSYPLRAVWRENPRRHSDSGIAFVISVPKKRLRHAVDRVSMRRKIREAYRLNRLDFQPPKGLKIDLAFIYVADKILDYKVIERAMKRILSRVSDTAATSIQSPHADEPSQNP